MDQDARLFRCGRVVYFLCGRRGTSLKLCVRLVKYALCASFHRIRRASSTSPDDRTHPRSSRDGKASKKKNPLRRRQEDAESEEHDHSEGDEEEDSSEGEGEEEEEEDEEGLTAHGEQSRRMKGKITDQERELLAEKPWALRGEVHSHDRPQNR